MCKLLVNDVLEIMIPRKSLILLLVAAGFLVSLSYLAFAQRSPEPTLKPLPLVSTIFGDTNYHLGILCNGLFQGSFTEMAFPLYSTVLSGLATGAPEAPCPAATHTILIRMLAGISGYSPFRSPIVRVLLDSDQRNGMTACAPFS